MLFAPFRRCLWLILPVVAFAALTPSPARSEAMILIEADSGKVLQADNATYPWYPASITKLMTAYTILRAVKEGRITLDTLFTVSPIASSQAPTKMGFPPGIQVTVDNALKMMMVRSANDMAVLLAEGLSGSVEKFADEMNRNAARLGMTQSSYVNPNGLPAEGQVTSARDMAILARAIIRDLPDYEYYMHIPAIKFGRRVTRNYNSLIGRYPGADGMKTGFICASGFNLVASATRGNRRLIAVVLGAPSSAVRAAKAMQMLERGFSGGALSWLVPSLGTVDSLVPVSASPPNLRDDICGPKRKRPTIESDDDNVAISGGAGAGEQTFSLFSAASASGTMKPSELLATAPVSTEPVVVYTGAKKTGAALVAAVASDEAAQTAKGKGKKGRQARRAAKPEAGESARPAPRTAAAPAAKSASKPAARPAPKADSKTDSKADSKPDSRTAAGKPAAETAEAKGGGRHAAARPANARIAAKKKDAKSE